MAAATILEAEAAGPFTTTGTTFVNPSGCTIAAASITGSTDYLMLCFATIGHDNNGAGADAHDQYEWRVTAGGTEIASSNSRAEFGKPNDADHTDLHQWWFWWTQYTSPASPVDIDFEQRSNHATYGIVSRNVRIYMLELDGDMEWVWNESTTTVVNTATFSGTNRATRTWTPSTAGNDWLLLWRGRDDADGNMNSEVQLMFGGAAVNGPSSREREDPDEFHTMSGFHVAESVAASSQTASIETRNDSTGTNSSHTHSGVFALDLSAFETVSHVLTNTTSIVNGLAPTFAEIATVTHNPATSGDSLVLAHTEIEFTSLHDVWSRIQYAGTSDPADLDTRKMAIGLDSTDDWGRTYCQVHNFTGSTAVDFDSMATTVQNRPRDTRILCISKEKVSAGPTSTGTLALMGAIASGEG